MSTGKIDSKKIIFSKLFSEDFWFVIPEYQRSYVWQEDNINALLEDLIFSFNDKGDSEYFLGSIVLKRTQQKDYPEYEVLDGQQRLTTFMMMMAVIRDLLVVEQDKLTLQSTICQKENRLKKIPAKQRLTYKIRESVEDFMELVILEIGGTNNTNALKKFADKGNNSVANMAMGILNIKKYLTSDEESLDLIEFTKFILNHALFIYVATDSTQDAFRMFTILNDRGIPLTAADIIKSENIGALSTGKEMKKYAELWEEIENEHGENFERFLQFIRTILVKDKAKSTIIDEFQKRIYNPNSPILQRGVESFRFIESCDKTYRDFIELEDVRLRNEYRNLISIMRIGNRSEDWIPPLLAYGNKFGREYIFEFLRKLDTLFSANWVQGVTPFYRINAMNSLIKYIERSRTPLELLSNNKLFFVNLEKYYAALDDNKIYRKSFARYLLLKIEYLKSDHSVHMTNYKTITIEHVLPQNPKSSSEWLIKFTYNEREYWTNRLGNLVLLNKRKNSSLGNLEFKEKKEKYLNSSFDTFKSSQIFIKTNDEWTPKILERRQKEALELLVSDSQKVSSAGTENFD